MPAYGALINHQNWIKTFGFSLSVLDLFPPHALSRLWQGINEANPPIHVSFRRKHHLFALEDSSFIPNNLLNCVT